MKVRNERKIVEIMRFWRGRQNASNEKLGGRNDEKGCQLMSRVA